MRSDTWRRFRRLTVGALALIGACFLLVSFTPLVTWWCYRLAGHWTDPNGEILITLGAAESTSDGILEANTFLRSKYAVRAWREGKFHSVVVSGGAAKGAIPIAESMKDFLVAEGVPGDAITAESRSQNTRENALDVTAMLRDRPGTKILLTSDYHMFRAHRAFTKAGLQVLPRPVPDGIKRAGTWKGRWPVFLDLLEESAKIAYYYARGWI